MLKRIGVVGGLAMLGFVVGYVSTYLGGYRYHIASTLYLPVHNSPHSAAELVALTRGHHPGALVWANGRSVSIYATGGFVSAERAMRVAYGEIVATNDRKFKSYYPDFADQIGLAWGSPFHRGLDGMLTGIGAALGFLFPPRSRVVRSPRPQRVAAMPITPAVVAGIAIVSVILTLAAVVVALLALRYHPGFNAITGAL